MRVTKDQILVLNEEIWQHSGGLLPILDMIPNMIGRMGKLFTGQDSDFPLDEEGNEKEGRFLPALGTLLPIALKALSIALSLGGAASYITHTSCYFFNSIIWRNSKR